MILRCIVGCHNVPNPSRCLKTEPRSADLMLFKDYTLRAWIAALIDKCWRYGVSSSRLDLVTSDKACARSTEQEWEVDVIGGMKYLKPSLI